MAYYTQMFSATLSQTAWTNFVPGKNKGTWCVRMFDALTVLKNVHAYPPVWRRQTELDNGRWQTFLYLVAGRQRCNISTDVKLGGTLVRHMMNTPTVYAWVPCSTSSPRTSCQGAQAGGLFSLGSIDGNLWKYSSSIRVTVSITVLYSNFQARRATSAAQNIATVCHLGRSIDLPLYKATSTPPPLPRHLPLPKR
jgi:hypothetical protein